MRPQDLTPAEIAELLNRAFLHDRGDEVEPVSAAVRQSLADHLGCHEDLREAVWQEWTLLLADEPDIEEDDAEYWLDVEFTEPCPD